MITQIAQQAAEPAQDKGFTNALIIGETSRCRIDRQLLRQAGIKETRLLTSGRDAVKRLMKESYDIVLCDLGLSDMTAAEFVRLMGGLITGEKPPVIALGDLSREPEVLDATAAGCAGYLLRPYSAADLNRMLSRTSAVMRSAQRRRMVLEDARHRLLKLTGKEELEAPVAKKPKNRAEAFFKKGTALLVEHRYDEAIVLFTKATLEQEAFADAYMGLATAWKGKGSIEKYREYLIKAAECHARLKEFEKMRTVITDILKTAPGAGDPFHELAFRLIRSTEFDAAASVYETILAHHDKSADIFAAAARACHFTEKPAYAAESMAKAISKLDGMPETAEVFKRLMGAGHASGAPRIYGRNRSSFMGSIIDAWEICKYTYRVYKKSADGGSELITTDSPFADVPPFYMPDKVGGNGRLEVRS